MSRYILNLTNCKNKPCWWKFGDPLFIPLHLGKTEFDFDMAAEEMESELVERIYSWVPRGVSNVNKEEIKELRSMPIGVDIEMINEECGELIALY